ncbi:MAG: hypothetical protein J6P93_02615 [Alphaproteobacteria bacterium]|nr:hypothetical protein [Alphaproteobacteria bacterium]
MIISHFYAKVKSVHRVCDESAQGTTFETFTVLCLPAMICEHTALQDANTKAEKTIAQKRHPLHPLHPQPQQLPFAILLSFFLYIH